LNFIIFTYIRIVWNTPCSAQLYCVFLYKNILDRDIIGFRDFCPVEKNEFW
jgi:hypothetical protein